MPGRVAGVQPRGWLGRFTRLLPSLRVARGDGPRKLALGLLGVLLFVLALQTLKEGASGLGPLVVDTLGVDSAVSALGFGWLLAYAVFSGSPVAAIALSFSAAGLLTAVQTFTMIAGSRFGASLVVLVLGFLYTLRGKAKSQSLEMGVLSLLTTYAVYSVAVPLGAMVLLTRMLEGWTPAFPAGFLDVIEMVFSPIVASLAAYLPGWALFLVGLALIILSFSLFDRALPDLSKESPIRGLEAHVFRPSVMFALGCVITLFTLSVSVSLGLLVPLSAKGIARRENVIPYIMGANITTFVDTLVATIFLGASHVFTIVLVEMLSVALVSLFILFFVYERFERALLGLSRRILSSTRGLGLFILLILLTPILMLLL